MAKFNAPTVDALVPELDRFVDEYVKFVDVYHRGTIPNPDLDRADTALRDGLGALSRAEVDQLIERARGVVDRIIQQAAESGWSEPYFITARNQLSLVWADLYALVWTCSNPGNLIAAEKALATAEKEVREVESRMNAAIDSGDEAMAFGLRDDLVYRMPAAVELAKVAVLNEKVNVWKRSAEVPAERADQAQRKADQAEAAYLEAHQAMVAAEEAVQNARRAAVLPRGASGNLQSRIARLMRERDIAAAGAEQDKKSRLRAAINVPTVRSAQPIDEAPMTVVHPRQSIVGAAGPSQVIEVMQ